MDGKININNAENGFINDEKNNKIKSSGIKRTVYIVAGCIGVALGAVGAVLPVLPTVPFLMLAVFCFGRSSEKLDNWFKQTRLYKNNLESFANGHGMTVRTKVKIMIMVTVLMTVGFTMMFMKALYVPCAILGGVWLFHILYFTFGVKKYTPDDNRLA